MVELRFDRPVDTDQVRNRLNAAGFHGAQVQGLGTGREMMVRMQAVGGSRTAPTCDCLAW